MRLLCFHGNLLLIPIIPFLVTAAIKPNVGWRCWRRLAVVALLELLMWLLRPRVAVAKVRSCISWRCVEKQPKILMIPIPLVRNRVNIVSEGRPVAAYRTWNRCPYPSTFVAVVVYIFISRAQMLPLQHTYNKQPKYRTINALDFGRVLSFS